MMMTLDGVEVVLADFSNPLYHTPFFIAVDHSRQAVVVACRGSFTFMRIFIVFGPSNNSQFVGTMSLRDAIVDIEAGPEPVEVTRLFLSFHSPLLYDGLHEGSESQ